MRQLPWISTALLVFGVTVWALSGWSSGPSVAGDGPSAAIAKVGVVNRAAAAPAPPKDPEIPGEELPTEPALRKAYVIHERNNLKMIRTKGIIGFGIMKDPAKPGGYAFRVNTTGNPKPTVPKSLEGIPIYEQYLVHGIQAFQLPIQQRRQLRPVPIGTSVSNMDQAGVAAPVCYSGTLGCRLRSPDRQLYALSNNHVFAVENTAAIGDRITQPSQGDNSCDFLADADVIGTLDRFVPLNFVGTNKQDSAIMKVAQVNLVPGVGVSTLPFPNGYGTPRSLGIDPVLGMRVQKCGRTTGFTRNITITAVKMSVVITYTTGSATFTGQFQFQADPGFPVAGGPGDSGSLVVDENRAPVGLLYGGGGGLVYANPIKLVTGTYNMVVDDGSAVQSAGPPDGKSGRFKRRP